MWGSSFTLHLLMQHDGKLETCPFGGTFFINKIQPENSSFRTITKIYHDPNNSTKTLIHPTHLLLKPQLFVINAKWIWSALKTHTTTSIIWTISMMTITSLMHMNNTIDKVLSNNNSLGMQINKSWRRTITNFHHQQWTQVSWLIIIITQKTSLMIWNLFTGIVAEY